MRFGERLRVSLGIASDTLEVLVPNMLIQPLVENAIQYGIAQTRSGGTLELTTGIHDGTLCVRIVNDGPAQAVGPHPIKGTGLGLGNARLRLEQLYGDAYQLHISGRAEGGAELRLVIPLRHSDGRGAASP
jgi:LytS/YehU family sensor histidine kinase